MEWKYINLLSEQYSKNKDINIRDKIVELMFPYVNRITNEKICFYRYYLNNQVMDAEDFKQIIYMAVLHALETFDSDKSEFKHWCPSIIYWYCLRQIVNDKKYLNYLNIGDNDFVYRDKNIDEIDNDINLDILCNELYSFFVAIYKKRNVSLKDINIYIKYMVEENTSLREVGDEVGIHRYRVRNIIDKIKRMVIKNNKFKKIKDYDDWVDIDMFLNRMVCKQ